MNPPQAPVSPLRKLPPLNSEHSGARLHRPKGPAHAISLPTMASHLSTTDAVHRSMLSPTSTLPVKRETSTETNMAPTSPVRKTSMSQTFMRPIKFVSNDGLPHSKRRRIKSACRTCQKRKTKCSGEEPVCETCIQNGHKCLGYNKKPPQTNKSQRRDSSELPVVGERAAEGGKSFNPPRSPKLLSQPPKMHQRHASQPTILPSQYDGFAGTDGASVDVEGDTLRESDGKRKFPNDTFYDMPLSPTAKRRNSESRVQSLLSDRKALRMPYFRYFGPTAIVPGYKQMVVEVRSKPAHSGSATASVGTPSSLTSPAVSHVGLSTNTLGPNTTENLLDEELPACHTCNQRLPLSRQPELPVYDPNDTAPNHPLITQLVKTFFEYVGCSFPFLREDAFIQDVEAKRVDSMLVDVVCAVAARFCEDPLFDDTAPRSARGAPFASRSKTLVMQEDTWACPNLAAVQTLLLLAYADFANGKDSGLWMLLGDAIRMAQDLGLHKLEGMRGEQSGRIKEERKAQEMSRNMSQTSSEFPEDSTTSSSERPFRPRKVSANDGEDNPEDPDDQPEKLTERIRTDTFWCLYFLDRAISSGLGRPVTLRDEEIEIDMPYQDASNPQPFPALIRMVRLYGQTTDIVNKIKKPADGSSRATRNNLHAMANELSKITENMPEKLEFKLPNLRRFSMCGQSANFVMFHVWLQALCLLIHRPSLSIGFEIPPLQDHSHNLALSSARTIADIARFAATKEFRGIHGNPFNSQPIYLAGCAFLEVAYPDPNLNPRSSAQQGLVKTESGEQASSSVKDADSREVQMLNHAKMFQDCYDIIGSLELYWKGVGYLLTVLDQKKQGIADPLLYTKEEMESATRFQGWDPKLWKFRRNLQRGGPNEADDVAMQDEANSQMEQQMREGPGFSGDISQVSAWSFAGVAGLPTAELSIFYNQHPESSPRNIDMQNHFGVPPQPMQQQQQQMLPPFTDTRTPMNLAVSLPGPSAVMLGNLGPHPLPIATGVSAPFDHPIPSSMSMAPPRTAYEVGYGPGSFMPLPVYGGGDYGPHGGNVGFLAESENVDINTLGLDMNQYLYQVGTYQ